MSNREPSFHPPGLTFLLDVSAGRWVEEALGAKFAHVEALVPRGYAAYARLFHPAKTRDDQTMRWSEVAEWAGRIVHPLMSFRGISSPKTGYGVGERPWSDDPNDGSLEQDDAVRLAGLLAGFTSTSDHCYFAVWEGYGQFSPGGMAIVTTSGGIPQVPPQEVMKAQRIKGVGRNYLLYEGQLSVIESFFKHRWSDPPTIWWPEDRNWCVSTDIDLDSTYIGGSEACIETLLAYPSFEILRATLNDPVYMEADTFNL